MKELTVRGMFQQTCVSKGKAGLLVFIEYNDTVYTQHEIIRLCQEVLGFSKKVCKEIVHKEHRYSRETASCFLFDTDEEMLKYLNRCIQNDVKGYEKELRWIRNDNLDINCIGCTIQGELKGARAE